MTICFIFKVKQGKRKIFGFFSLNHQIVGSSGKGKVLPHEDEFRAATCVTAVSRRWWRHVAPLKRTERFRHTVYISTTVYSAFDEYTMVEKQRAPLLRNEINGGKSTMKSHEISNRKHTFISRLYRILFNIAKGSMWSKEKQNGAKHKTTRYFEISTWKEHFWLLTQKLWNILANIIDSLW